MRHASNAVTFADVTEEEPGILLHRVEREQNLHMVLTALRLGGLHDRDQRTCGVDPPRPEDTNATTGSAHDLSAEGVAELGEGRAVSRGTRDWIEDGVAEPLVKRCSTVDDPAV